jgi:hypothetical protein
VPFTADQFLDIFASYNEWIYPAQWFLFAIGLAISGSVFLKRNVSGLIAFGLAILWIWSGSVYHLYSFTAINGAAYLFGMLFICEGLLFLFFGTFRAGISFKFRNDAASLIGVTGAVYALLLYPLIGYFFGHQYPRSPTFGAPCPVAILTLSVLMFADRGPLYLYLIPVAWAAVATSAAYLFGVYEDLGLTVFAAMTVLILAARSPVLFLLIKRRYDGKPSRI